METKATLTTGITNQLGSNADLYLNDETGEPCQSINYMILEPALIQTDTTQGVRCGEGINPPEETI